jgi:hypothetical protein
MICGNKKRAKSKKILNDGLNNFLGHVFPILDIASSLPGHRDTWAS